MPWLTLQEAKDAVASSFHHASYAELLQHGEFWDQVIPNAFTTAQTDINAILVGSRGLTPAQVLTWAGLKDIHRSQVLFWAIKMGQGLQGLDPTLVSLVENFDRRAWLEEADLIDADGEPIEPDETVSGPVGHGKIDVSDSVFYGKKW